MDSENDGVSGGIEGINVTVSGVHDEDNFIRTIVHEEIENVLRKLSRMVMISSFDLHVRKYSKGGTRTKYSVQAKLITEEGNFFADDYEWELTKTVKGVLEKIEREVLKKEDKEKVYTRGP